MEKYSRVYKKKHPRDKLNLRIEGTETFIRQPMSKPAWLIAVIALPVAIFALLMEIPRNIAGQFILAIGGGRGMGLAFTITNRPLAWFLGIPFNLALIIVLSVALFYLLLFPFKKVGIVLDEQGVTYRQIRKTIFVAWANISSVESKYFRNVSLHLHNQKRVNLKLRHKAGGNMSRVQYRQIFWLVESYFEKYRK